jgi:beta-ureidopropionase / N-carbamoyl-L-amino-acid hydrolase
MDTWRPEDLEAGSKLARRMFDHLERESADDPGLTRKAYGEGERMAHELATREARALGAEISTDAAGNLFMTLPGQDRGRCIIIASHMDTVPHGGNYDGAAGVVAGIACQAAFHAAGRKPPFDLTVIALRAEESSWFPHSYIGSKTALGILDPDQLDLLKRSDNGRSLADHMRDEGFDPEAVRRGESRIDKERVVAYIEAHIEQGPILIKEEVPVAVVTGIRGSFRYRNARCEGTYDHSGAMPRAWRRDAAAATADLIVTMDAFWQEHLDQGHDLTITFGEVYTNAQQHAFQKVAGEMGFCVDVRSQDVETLDIVKERLHQLIADIGKDRRVDFVLGDLTGSTGAKMSPHLQALMKKAAETASISHISMGSGAGHDAATFSLEGVPTAMIFIRNANGSHNPDEAMDMEDFDKAFSVLAHMLSAPPEAWLDG